MLPPRVLSADRDISGFHANDALIADMVVVMILSAETALAFVMQGFSVQIVQYTAMPRVPAMDAERARIKAFVCVVDLGKVSGAMSLPIPPQQQSHLSIFFRMMSPTTAR